MSLLKEYIDSIISEMPIGKLEKLGNFEKNSAFKAQDRKLLSNPKAIEKIHRQWEKTPYEFDIYLLNIPQLNKSQFKESGKIEDGTVLEIIKKTTGQELKFNPNAITILFNGNSGAEKVPMTGWVMAHRFGHSARMDNNEWNEFTNKVKEIINDLATQVYNVSKFDRGGIEINKPDLLRLIFQQIGTMKSAREGKLRTYYEFYYELLAQYLLTGSIKFNPVPLQLIVGHLPYGRKKKRRAVDPEIADIWTRDLEIYASEIESHIDNFVGSCVGDVYLM